MGNYTHQMEILKLEVSYKNCMSNPYDIKNHSTFQAVIKCYSSGLYCCALQLIISEFNKKYPTFIGVVLLELVGSVFH